MHPEDAEAQNTCTDDTDESQVITKVDMNGYKPVDLNDPGSPESNPTNSTNVVTPDISIRVLKRDRGQQQHQVVQPVASNSEHNRSYNSPSPFPETPHREHKKNNSTSGIITKDVVEVSCGKGVSCECIKSFIVHSCSWLSKSDLDSLHVAMAEIEAIKPRSVLANCELKILSATSSEKNITFYSGKGRNKFMVVSNAAGVPHFVTRTCPRATFRRGVSTFQYLEWLNVIRVIISASAFLYVLFWIFDQLHAELPIEGCLDLKVKMHETMGAGIANLIPGSKRYCSAATQLARDGESGMSPAPQTPLFLNTLASWFKPKTV